MSSHARKLFRFQFPLAIAAFVLCAIATDDASAQRSRREISWVNPDIPKHAGLEHKVLSSEAMSHDVGYVVWTPPGYDASGATRYPVVYFLHGAGGNESKDAAGFSSLLKRRISSGKFPAAICVFPNGGMSGYRGEAETMIVNELIPLIDNDYRTIAKTEGRVAAGFSMGAAGSVGLSMKHPELFTAAAGWGGALAWRGDYSQSSILKAAKENLDRLKTSDFALLTINGDQDRPDGFDLLKKALTSAGITHETVILKETNHNLGKYYELSGTKLTDFLAKHLESPESE